MSRSLGLGLDRIDSRLAANGVICATAFRAGAEQGRICAAEQIRQIVARLELGDADGDPAPVGRRPRSALITAHRFRISSASEPDIANANSSPPSRMTGS